MNLMRAREDLKYLLNRGYRRKVALDFVANHYRLPMGERHLLARCVFSDVWIAEVRKKLLRPGELSGKILAIDGFNVLITIESLMDGKAILCEDGLVRDLKYQGRYRLTKRSRGVVERVVNSLSELTVGKAVFFYGKNVPKSGEVKKMTESALEKFEVPGEVRLVKSPDFELKSFENVATADTAIIAAVSRVFDLAAYAGREFRPIPFDELLRGEIKVHSFLTD